MSALDYNTVEAELREIEADFAGGRLGAFGSATSQEEVMRELGKVGQLEVQVFIRTCAQIRALSEEEGLVQRTLREHASLAGGGAGAAPASGHQRTGSKSGDAQTPPPPPDGEADGVMASPAANGSSTLASVSPRGAAASSASFADMGANASMAGPGLGGGDVWSLHGSTDKAFEDMAKLFKAKEAALKASADNLRQMAKHVGNANDALQRAHGGSA
jgi:hypothetical protein